MQRNISLYIADTCVGGKTVLGVYVLLCLRKCVKAWVNMCVCACAPMCNCVHMCPNAHTHTESAGVGRVLVTKNALQ